ncbi:MAG: hypothetical protein AAGI70_12070, partial [Pseudomonadota bacterium]
MPETAPEDPALANEEARLRIERLRLENAAMAAEAARPFWDIRARGLIQAGIGGVVAGALVYAFLRDNVATIENLRARGERLQISQQEVSETLVDLQAQEKAALARGAELERQNQAQEARQAALQDEAEELQDEAEELTKRRDLLEAQANEQLQRQAELQAD